MAQMTLPAGVRWLTSVLVLMMRVETGSAAAAHRSARNSSSI